MCRNTILCHYSMSFEKTNITNEQIICNHIKNNIKNNIVSNDLIIKQIAKIIDVQHNKNLFCIIDEVHNLFWEFGYEY